jgi:hypothetical protein
MAGRMLCRHLPDRTGGTKIALVCVLIEAVGQALIRGPRRPSHSPAPVSQQA